MNRAFVLSFAVFSGVMLGLGADAANAQLFRRATPMVQPSQPGPTAPAGQSNPMHNDIFLANWIGADNQCEILLNQFASERASSQEVKDFTQEMIRAHSDLANKLNQAVTSMNAAAYPRTGQVPYTTGYRGAPGTAPIVPGTTPAAPGTAPAVPGSAPAAPRTTPATPGTTPATPGTTPAAPALGTAPSVPSGGDSTPMPGNPARPGSAPGKEQGTVSDQTGGMATIPAGSNTSIEATSRLNAVNFKRDINGRLAVIVEQKLGEKKGADFDRCFMQGQIAAHVHMLATLDAAKTRASGQLKPLLDEAAGVTQKHLSLAESLLAKLDTQRGTR